jgi:poly-gamma-glutamate capsule biosynthesis protein CapA/YwtB (metallophosphatase superfamily)
MSKKYKLFYIFLFNILVLTSFSIFYFQNKINYKKSFTGTRKNTASSFNPTPSLSPSYNSTPNLSLETIFDDDLYNRDEAVTLITTGDVLAGRSVNFKLHSYKNYSYSWEKTAFFLKNSDLTLINLESPLVKDCPLTNSGMVFCGSPEFIKGLLLADIDIANLANNHILNWGEENVLFTKNLLSQNNILSCGYPEDKICFKQVKGKNLAFLGYNLLNKFSEENLIENVKKAKLKADYVILSLHWGAEYQAYPASWQVDLAHKLIMAGASIIVGNHPHWYQPIEVYKEGLILYAHGNFIFDQEWSRETKTGFTAKHVLLNGKVADSQIYPVLISDYCQPEFLQNEEKDKILNDLREKSFNLKNLNKN